MNKLAIYININIILVLSDSNKRKFYLVSSLSAGDKIKLFYMLQADQAYYGKKGFSWYIWDTNRDDTDKGGWIEKKKWYTERGLESKNNMHGTRFCYASKEKLQELGIKITGLSV